MTFEEVKQLVLFMKEQGVYKFQVGEMSAEFGIGASTSMEVPMTVDDESEKARQIREILKQAVDDEQADLLYST
jgi:hypothetical protein